MAGSDDAGDSATTPHADAAGWSATTGRRLLDDHAPGAAQVFDRLCAIAPTTLEVTIQVRQICADTLGVAGLPGDSPGGAAQSVATVDDAITAMARQFATDVAALDGDLRRRFGEACGEHTFATVQAIYLADGPPRVMAVLDAVAGAGESWRLGPADPTDGAASWSAIDDFLRVVHQLDRVDPVLTEVVRLHGARQHNCRLCRSIRSRPALLAGATEELFDAIDQPGWADLPPRTRTALRLTDAVIWHPAHVSEELVAAVRSEFDPAEAVELVLDVMRNAANKIAVALAADAPNVAEGVEIYEIDHDGVAHYGLALP